MNVSCEDGGVCRSLIGAYRCERMNGSLTGRHCETTLFKAVLLAYFARSVGFIMIAFLSSVAIFIINLDALKYVFGISVEKKGIAPVKKMKTKRRKYLVIVHHFYVNSTASDI